MTDTHNNRFRWIERGLTILVFAAVMFGTYAAFSGEYGGATINAWQMKYFTQDGKFFPILTIFAYVLPVAVIGLPVKLAIKKIRGQPRS